MPSRVSFKVCSVIDSRNILDMSGAEKLLNRGDMLFHPVNRSTPIRLQGVFISDDEVCTLMDAIRLEEPVYDSEILEQIKGFAESIKNSRRSTRAYGTFEDENEDGGYLNDAQFLEAVELAIKSGKISTSFLQRKLSIGYGKAAKYIDAMEDIGIVSEPNGQKPRMVLLSMEEWKEKYERIKLN
jgi:S-DNA-T family DNA segregation ATPase FtsK/SpoIIIE